MSLCKIFPLLALSLGFGSTLGAQTAVMRVLLDQERIEASATLSVIDAKGTRTLAHGFTTLLQGDELKAFDVPLRVHILGSGTEKELLSTYRLLPKPQWILVARRGAALLAQGEGLPEAQTFAHQLQQAGFRDRVKDLRAYLKEFPRALEAREELLNQLRQRGERTAQRYMGVQVPPPKERLDRGDLAGFLHAQDAPEKVDLSSANALSPVQDFEAWGDFAHELDFVFGSGEWRELDFLWLREGRPLDTASPTLRAVYKRWQPSVEAALRQEPESESFWNLWIWMSQAQGGKPLGPLLSTLSPSPLTPKDQWPPERVVHNLFARARTQEEWRTLQALYLAKWENEPHVLREPAPPRPPQLDQSQIMGSDQALLFDHDWTLCLAPLLECCLRGGDPGLADTYLMEALNASRWAALPEKGATVAVCP